MFSGATPAPTEPAPIGATPPATAPRRSAAAAVATPRETSVVPPPSAPTTGRRAGTSVVECSACDARTRVGYLDFVLLNLPVGVWLPLPGLAYNRRMTCPACGQWTWLQAHWFD